MAALWLTPEEWVEFYSILIVDLGKITTHKRIGLYGGVRGLIEQYGHV